MHKNIIIIVPAIDNKLKCAIMKVPKRVKIWLIHNCYKMVDNGVLHDRGRVVLAI